MSGFSVKFKASPANERYVCSYRKVKRQQALVCFLLPYYSAGNMVLQIKLLKKINKWTLIKLPSNLKSESARKLFPTWQESLVFPFGYIPDGMCTSSRAF